MQTRPLGHGGIAIPPLVFGGNVFGWTADEKESFRLLDALLDNGLFAIDTADVYSRFAGNAGGESETLIGRWLSAEPSRRAKMVIFTKVGIDMGGPDRQGLSARWIATAIEDSLRRLQTDHVDVYFAHRPDPSTPDIETLSAFAKLVEAGKVRAIGASNFSAAQLETALSVSRDNGLPRYEVLQPEYNLYARAGYEQGVGPVAVREGLGVVPYFALAAGFLTGKYRSEADLGKSRRGSAAARYLDARGFRILAALDNVAAAHGAEPGEVALAWLMQRPGITAPIASASSVDQLGTLLRSVSLALSEPELALLDSASAG